MQTCERCFRKVLVTTMSIFNTQTICADDPTKSCRAKEQKHPKYAEAKAAELAAVRAGDYNFPGIGKPADL